MTQTDVTAPTMKMTCKDLPAEGRPASFNGAIGRLDFRASLQPDKIAQGDPVTLTLVVGGKGNIENIGAPSFSRGPAHPPLRPQTGAQRHRPGRQPGAQGLRADPDAR
ncbi:MAG: hypothetical protein U1F77_18455 [Kiritimatiellia bacterium]